MASVEGAVDHRLQAIDGPLDQRHEQVLLAREVAVERRASDPDRGADLVNARARETLLEEQVRGGLENHLATAGAVDADVRHGGPA